jgi:REP element-mobilizing transposase RayT
MQNGIEFFTATCLKWQGLLQPDEHKNIIMDSLKFLVDDKRIWLYGYVIMPNHIHLMWCKQDAWLQKNVQQMFLKYTAQQIKFNLIQHNPKELDNYISTQKDRDYHFWERRPYSATMYNRKVASQKIDYMHYNPVKAGLCEMPEQYKFSSFRFYELNQEDDPGFLTHYAEHL